MKVSLSLLAVCQSLPQKEKNDGNFVKDQSAPRVICGGEITSDADIKSPGFDDPDRGYYYNYLDCTWEINLPDVSSIMIYPEVFEVESAAISGSSQRDCRYDWLSVNWEEDDGDYFDYQFCSVNDYDWDSYTTSAYSTYTASTASTTYGGRRRRAPVKNPVKVSNSLGSGREYLGDFSEPLQIEGDKATINFHTDASLFLRGFHLRIEGIKNDKIQYSSGTVTSPGWPENYGNNEMCVFKLNADPGKIIKITFEEFDVERATLCEYDSLSIMGRKHCGNWSRKSPEKEVLIYAESTELIWSTDGSVTEKGFRFSWESIDNPIEVPSGALESAAGFHAHIELFLMQLNYQMRKTRPKRLKFLNRGWDNVQIEETHFQTEGDCNNEVKYESYDFKNFDATVSMCTNINNLASNARQFFDNFVCLDDHDHPNRTLKRWNRMADKIDNISEKIKAHHSGLC